MPVAAAGNEFAEGNPLEFPASLPHVLTVAAVGPDLASSFFSNTSAAIDLVRARRVDHDRGAAARRRRRRAERLPALERHELRRADGRRRGRLGRARRGRTSRPTRSRRSIRLRRDDIGRPGWTARHRLRPAVGRPRADRRGAAARPVRAQRRHRLGRRPRVRHARPARLPRPRPRAAVRAARRVRGPGRRLPDPRPRRAARPHQRRSVARRQRSRSSVHRDGARRIASRALRRSTRRGGRTERITLRNALAARARLLRVACACSAGRTTSTPATRSRSARRCGTARPSRRPAPTGPRPGRPCPRARPESAPAGCRAGTTRRRARPGTPSRRR